ncbi:hypothetical protein CHS0354_018596 [Potamilus streckersoni]|uniref:Neurotransmitter-gated ion-channel ligand-binding domain-containing protein n=1 Tax=Potamilus streckersoni TaxID=2493646 RepID=A0AAE0WC00_9BIVA|nr:hypothetical protein CHS0354_018596 [Potamilus streckersoni]
MRGLIAIATVIYLARFQASSIDSSRKGLDDRCISDRRSAGTRARERLMKTLLEDYMKSVKPEPYDGSPLQVNMSMSLLNLDSVDYKEAIIETHSWVFMSWIDERLSWNPSDFHQVKSIHIPTDYIWIPDIDLYNNDGDAEKPISDMIADVNSDGSVTYVSELHLKSLCEVGQQAMKVVRIARLLGFDEMVCKLKFGSWTYDATEMNIVTTSSQVNLLDFRRVSTDEIQVKSTSANVDQLTFNCCPNPYKTATFTIVVSNEPKEPL